MNVAEDLHRGEGFNENRLLLEDRLDLVAQFQDLVDLKRELGVGGKVLIGLRPEKVVNKVVGQLKAGLRG